MSLLHSDSHAKGTPLFPRQLIQAGDARRLHGNVMLRREMLRIAR